MILIVFCFFLIITESFMRVPVSDRSIIIGKMYTNTVQLVEYLWVFFGRLNFSQASDQVMMKILLNISNYFQYFSL